MDELVAQLERRSVETVLRAAVFVDRDGVINVEQGYLRDASNALLLPNVAQGLALLNQSGLTAIVVTNQSALGRGLMTIDEFEAVNETLWQQLTRQGAIYDALYYCPHRPDQIPPCICRKPYPGLLLMAATDHSIDLKRSFMIGDKIADLQAGWACGCQSVLIRTGFGDDAYGDMKSSSRPADYVGVDFLQVAKWIVTRGEMFEPAQ